MGALDGISILGGGKPQREKKTLPNIRIPKEREKVVVEVQRYPVLSNAELVVYTDGSVYTLLENYCNNPANDFATMADVGRTFGAYAFAIWNAKTDELIYEEVKAGENWGRQGPEVLGVYFALKHLVETYQGHTAVLFSDSRYVLDSAGTTWLDDGWVHTWLKNDFKTLEGNEVKYHKHHKLIHEMVKQFNRPDNFRHIQPKTIAPLTMYHVKGHGADARNDYVDKLAGKARKEFQEDTLRNR
jgi:ribonuclease HI